LSYPLDKNPELRYLALMENTPPFKLPHHTELAKLTAEVPVALANHLAVVRAMRRIKLKTALTEAMIDWCAKMGAPFTAEVVEDDQPDKPAGS